MNDILTPKEVQEMLRISYSTLRRLRKENELPAIILSKNVVRYLKKDVEEYLEKRKETNGKER